MREKMDSEMEKLISKCISNADIRKICDENRFAEAVNNSDQPIKELVEDVLTRLSLKDKPFEIFQPATEENISRFKQIVID